MKNIKTSLFLVLGVVVINLAAFTASAQISGVPAILRILEVFVSENLKLEYDSGNSKAVISHLNNGSATSAIEMSDDVVNITGATLQEDGVEVAKVVINEFTANELTGCTGSEAMKIKYSIYGDTLIFGLSDTLSSSSAFSCSSDGVQNLLLGDVPQEILDFLAGPLGIGQDSYRSTVFTCTDNSSIDLCEVLIDESTARIQIVNVNGWSGTGSVSIPIQTAVLMAKGL